MPSSVPAPIAAGNDGFFQTIPDLLAYCARSIKIHPCCAMSLLADSQCLLEADFSAVLGARVPGTVGATRMFVQ